MSVAQTFDYPQADPGEPFGQAGVRQYAGRLLAWVCVTIALSAAAMAHRSSGFADLLQWKGAGQRLFIASGNSQLVIDYAVSANLGSSDTGWDYSGGYRGRRWRPLNTGPWQSSLGETAGIEGSLSPSSAELQKGAWLRLRWVTVAALFTIQPLVYGLRRLLRRSERARVDVS
ncbi:MAG TPA: hypothetical protein VF595_12540 [Tepidisphaeraceae bacterium]|jgi:hypothetical protein